MEKFSVSIELLLHDHDVSVLYSGYFESTKLS